MTGGIACNAVYNVTNWSSASCNYLVSGSNFASWMTLPQNFVIASMNFLASWCSSSSRGATSFMAFFRSTIFTGGVSRYTKAFKMLLSFYNYTIISPSIFSFVSASSSVVFSPTCLQVSTSAYSTCTRLLKRWVFSTMRWSVSFFSSVISSTVFVFNSSCVFFSSSISYAFSSINFYFVLCSSSNYFCVAFEFSYDRRN